ncbi:hypothetical protein Ocin01_04457 [Orchesella cincta]|uniref:Uncharacterized protein n=1 Tax=Orchesella cincta TaxID=48709 RepID=A0A1D2NAD7_ORCCI|nr:hypothetical protein Ocin01_04457 [Orchesella cincta]
MPCKIYLRRYQSLCQRDTHSSQDTTIFAPLWVKEGLTELAEHLKGTTFEVFDSPSYSRRDNPSSTQPVESFTINENFNDQSLKILQKVARNESHNTSGVINTSLYSDIKDKRVLYSIRDLVRQCIIVGTDEITKCGGYHCAVERQTKQRVYVCDLAALQFQQAYNTGRLVLIQKEEPYKGILDDLIYEQVVGERKKQFDEIVSSWDSNNKETRSRYIRHDGFGLPGKGYCFIDSKAYRKFVALDVLLSGLALGEIASKNEEKLNFKFLKYGTGFFAWKFGTVLNNLILPGVIDGLEHLFMRNDEKVKASIKNVELPFYKIDFKSMKRIKEFQAKYGVSIIATSNDALKQTCGLITATTNCGDNHAVCGNEMEYGSVDAAIAENLASKGNKFSANINTMMSERYIEV